MEMGIWDQAARKFPNAFAVPTTRSRQGCGGRASAGHTEALGAMPGSPRPSSGDPSRRGVELLTPCLGLGERAGVSKSSGELECHLGRTETLPLDWTVGGGQGEGTLLDAGLLDGKAMAWTEEWTRLRDLLERC